MGAEATGEGDEVETVEIRITAILTGNVRAEPGVEPVTDAGPKMPAVSNQALTG